jgi:hypothetical protein
MKRKIYINKESGKEVEVTSIRRSMFDNRWFTFVDEDNNIFDMREDEFKELYQKKEDE